MTPLILTALLACPAPGDDGHDATSVGNPGKMGARVAKGSGTETISAEADATGFFLTPCDVDEATVVDLDGELDLLGGGAFEVPGGTWCSLVLSLHDTLVVEGTGSREQTFALELQVEGITLSSEDGFTIDGDDFVLELGTPGWFDEEILFGDDGREVLVDDEHPLHDLLVRGRSPPPRHAP